MTVYDDNPAGRLHNLLTAFKHSAGPAKIGVTWAGLLNMTQDAPELFVRLAQVYSLPKDITSEMASLDSSAEYDGDMTLRWQEPVQAAFGTSLFSNSSSADIAAHFTERTLDSLETCSYVLHRYRPQPAIPDSDVKRIRECIIDLEDEIITCDDVERELRTVLLHHTYLMKRALDDLFISGNTPVEEALDQVLGVTARRGDLFARVKESPERKVIWERWTALVTTVGVALQLGTLPLALTSHDSQPPPPAVEIVIEPPGQDVIQGQALPVSAVNADAVRTGDSGTSP